MQHQFLDTFAFTTVAVLGALFAWAVVTKASVFAFFISVGGFISARQISSGVVQVGAVAAALVAIAAMFRIPVVRRPIVWAWTTILTDPLGRWYRRILKEHTEEVVAPLIEPIRSEVEETRNHIRAILEHLHLTP